MFSLLNVIQIIIIVTVILLFYLKFIRNSSSEKLVYGLLGLSGLWGLSFIMYWLQLKLLGNFIHWIALFLSLSLVVVFQPELRKFFAMIGSINGWKNIILAIKNNSKHNGLSTKNISEIIKAIEYMSNTHTGALIVFVNNITEETIIERKGIQINADISNELLLTIFFNNTPLHDGALIIKNNKIAYAGAILPLSTNKLNWRYGTRHRAALGMSENTSALIIVISEETGDISIAENGGIKKYDNVNKLQAKLEKFLSTK
ncbi:MAG: diadenylate cyclase CdaA [Alphaproteobacteria bacterium]|nr:diadenylate cyclase CdaA [Alphaproteobacteria bacterium]